MAAQKALKLVSLLVGQKVYKSEGTRAEKKEEITGFWRVVM